MHVQAQMKDFKVIYLLLNACACACMYMCVHVCMYMNFGICLCLYMCNLCACACMCICVHVFVCWFVLCVLVCLCVCMHACYYLCVFPCACVCVCIFDLIICPCSGFSNDNVKFHNGLQHGMSHYSVLTFILCWCSRLGVKITWLLDNCLDKSLISFNENNISNSQFKMYFYLETMMIFTITLRCEHLEWGQKIKCYSLSWL